MKKENKVNKGDETMKKVNKINTGDDTMKKENKVNNDDETKKKVNKENKSIDKILAENAPCKLPYRFLDDDHFSLLKRKGNERVPLGVEEAFTPIKLSSLEMTLNEFPTEENDYQVTIETKLLVGNRHIHFLCIHEPWDDKETTVNELLNEALVFSNKIAVDAVYCMQNTVCLYEGEDEDRDAYEFIHLHI